LTFS
jgi:hypothetical protein